jgi:hypothetical protein
VIAITFVEVVGSIVGTIVGLAAIVGAIGILARSEYAGRPVRWLWRRNVSEPIGEWNRRIVREIVDDRVEHLMHHRNNGSSLLDLSEKLDRVDRQVQQLLGHDAERDVVGKRYGKPAPVRKPKEA